MVRYRVKCRAAQQLVGVPALQLGNVIEVGTGLIGIETPAAACARFRQRLWSRFFFGELYAFKIGPARSPRRRRSAACIFCNLVRTAFLVVDRRQKWRQSHRSPGHDPFGLTILLSACSPLASLLLVSRNPNSALQWSKVDVFPRRVRPESFGCWPASNLHLFGGSGSANLYDLHPQSITNTRWAVHWPVLSEQIQIVSIPRKPKGCFAMTKAAVTVGSSRWPISDDYSSLVPGTTAASHCPPPPSS